MVMPDSRVRIHLSKWNMNKEYELKTEQFLFGYTVILLEHLLSAL